MEASKKLWGGSHSKHHSSTPAFSPAKVQEEIDAVVGAGRAPSMQDKLRMPYTNAVIHELQRYQKTRIENFPRMTTQDVVFRGHTIPKVDVVALESLCPRGEGWQGASNEIRLCPWTVCSLPKVPGLSQSLVGGDGDNLLAEEQREVTAAAGSAHTPVSLACPAKHRFPAGRWAGLLGLGA